ncbi:hypothetical protein A5747_13210 [Mycobacterium sp. IS-836]|nr:hypothetical protein A5747_13210 [Mycobacterium sp. IS-836]
MTERLGLQCPYPRCWFAVSSDPVRAHQALLGHLMRGDRRHAIDYDGDAKGVGPQLNEIVRLLSPYLDRWGHSEVGDLARDIYRVINGDN